MPSPFRPNDHNALREALDTLRDHLWKGRDEANACAQELMDALDPLSIRPNLLIDRPLRSLLTDQVQTTSWMMSSPQAKALFQWTLAAIGPSKMADNLEPQGSSKPMNLAQFMAEPNLTMDVVRLGLEWAKGVYDPQTLNAGARQGFAQARGVSDVDTDATPSLRHAFHGCARLIPAGWFDDEAVRSLTRATYSKGALTTILISFGHAAALHHQFSPIDPEPLVVALVRAGVDLNAPEPKRLSSALDSPTMFHHALDQGVPALAHALVKHGADPFVPVRMQSRDPQSPEDYLALKRKSLERRTPHLTADDGAQQAIHFTKLGALLAACRGKERVDGLLSELGASQEATRWVSAKSPG